MRTFCPRRQQARKHFYATNQILKEICANYTKTFQHIQSHTKLNMSDCTSAKTFENLILIQDTLMIEVSLINSDKSEIVR